MANRLKNLVITEVASCRKGINPDAMVVFAKAKEDLFAEPVIKGIFEDALKKRETSDMFWELKHTLSDVISSIWHDPLISMADKSSQIRIVVQDYVTAIEGVLSVAKSAKGGVINKNRKEVHKMTDAEKIYDQTALENEVKKATEAKDAELTVLKALYEMTDEEKGYYKSLAEDKKAEFIKKSTAERKNEVQKSKSTDETIVIKGQSISKSAVGDVMFHVLKSQQEDIEKANQQAAMEKAEREKTEFIQKAENEFSYIPGTPDLKGRMLKAVYDISEQDVRDAILGVFKSSDTNLSTLFSPIGATGATASVSVSKADAATKLDALVSKTAAEMSISKSAAYAVVLKSDEGKQLAQASK